jgi:hypothetical protein
VAVIRTDPQTTSEPIATILNVERMDEVISS